MTQLTEFSFSKVFSKAKLIATDIIPASQEAWLYVCVLSTPLSLANPGIYTDDWFAKLLGDCVYRASTKNKNHAQCYGLADHLNLCEERTAPICSDTTLHFYINIAWDNEKWDLLEIPYESAELDSWHRCNLI